MHTYTARVAREGKWWMIRVPDIDGLTQARRLGEVEQMARSLIAVTLDAPGDSFDVRIELEAIEELRVTERLDALTDERRELDELRERVQRDVRILARDLAGKGLTVRDIGAVLGVSFQRAQQLIDV